jgi:hypothetical protein
MLRESVTPNHNLALSEVSPQDLLDLNALKLTTGNRIKKQT